jgi:hypothetical protein
VVKRALALLGVQDEQHYNTAFQALQRMGRSADGKSFDPRIPAQWWEREVFQKVRPACPARWLALASAGVEGIGQTCCRHHI